MLLAHINDLQLAYSEQGAGETVVLLHGLGSCKEDWQPQIQALAPHYRVIALDLRGHGATTKAKTGYNITQYAADVMGLLDALQCDAVHLIGFSLGGMITLEFATRYPERLRSATVINATPAVVVNNWQTRRFFWSRLLFIQWFGCAYMGKKIAQMNFPAPEQAALRAQAERQFASNDKWAYFRATKSLLGWDIRAKLKDITCPLLAVSSDQDYTSVTAKQAMVDAIPRAELQVIANARHLVPMEQPDALNKTLLAWLKLQSSH